MSVAKKKELKPVGLGHTAAGDLEQGLRGVDPKGLRPAVGGEAQEGAGPATDVEDLLSRPDADAVDRKEPGKTRERTVYTLTDEGLEALREYAQTPVAFTPLKSDALLRLLICDLVGEPVTRESMSTLREEIADLRERLDDGERTARELPHRDSYLLTEVEQELVAQGKESARSG